MALKGDRLELYTDATYFANTAMIRGGVACLSTVGSGAAMDQSAALVNYPANSSGAVPIGLLLNNMVNIDLTRQHINFYQDEMIVGGKVTLGVKGWWVTNSLTTGPSAIAVGDLAVLTSSGNIMNLPASYEFTGSWNKAQNPLIGRFRSTADEDGYAKVAVDLRS